MLTLHTKFISFHHIFINDSDEEFHSFLSLPHENISYPIHISTFYSSIHLFYSIHSFTISLVHSFQEFYHYHHCCGIEDWLLRQFNYVSNCSFIYGYSHTSSQISLKCFSLNFKFILIFFAHFLLKTYTKSSPKEERIFSLVVYLYYCSCLKS